jgi:DNA-binding NarL/FixJ family response regulator
MATSAAPQTPPGSAPTREVELVRFVGSLCAATSLEQLERRFVAGFARVSDARMYGYDLVDPHTGLPTCVATANVSDAFVARYEREAREVDPVLAQALDTGRPAYNLAMMSPDEWEDSAVYRRAYRMHRIRHVVEVPVTSSGRILGNLHFAESDPECDIGPDQIALAEALAGVLGETIARLRSRDRLQRDRDEAMTALDRTATPVVISDPNEPELRANACAQRLLAGVVDADEALNRLLARPVTDGAFSRRIDVELATGEGAVLQAAATPLADQPRGVVAVLMLRSEQPGLAPGALAALTPREAEVAVLIADGLADREIAERLYLSHHTVSQYVKRIYRKLDVDSRVALTRLLLTGCCA